ncbi:MAG TPA: YbhB/YbcL family Raf kinase inhibitor-like protein [Nitriliruptorales bacterium]|nr:YbhB/YbcL family Raf kinase inhibitor-like protein [Nitriliruptorales bacterium]
MADVAPSRAAGDAPRTVYLTCAAFQDHDELPTHLTCEGEGVAPALAWRGIPGDTVEIAVVCEDPDASGGTFVHWMMAGIDSGLDGLDENVIPEGAAVGVNDAGTTGYAAPCPPPGEEPHRYVFTVFASADGLALEHGFTARELHDALQGSVIAVGTLTATFERAR